METYTLQQGLARMTCVRALPEDVARAWLDEGADGPVLVHTDTSIGPVVRKRDVHAPTPWRRARAARAFTLGRALAAAGVPAARVLAVRMERRQPATLYMREAPGKPLHMLLARAGGLGGPELASIARAVATLHAMGFRQRDLKAPNIIVGTGEAPSCTLIDFDGMRSTRMPAPRRLRLRDLGRLAASFTSPTACAGSGGGHVWERYVEAYLADISALCPVAPPSSAVRSEWITQTLRQARNKLARNARRRRPLA